MAHPSNTNQSIQSEPRLESGRRVRVVTHERSGRGRPADRSCRPRPGLAIMAFKVRRGRRKPHTVALHAYEPGSLLPARNEILGRTSKVLRREVEGLTTVRSGMDG